MSLIHLNQENITSLESRLACPSYERNTVKTGIVHIGVGGFHHVLKKQDCLYTLITQHPDGKDACEIIGSIVEYIFAIETPELAIDKMAHPDTKIVSLTITEGGYNFNPNTGDFNFDNPDIQHELEHPNQPKTVFGFLTAALKKRRDEGLPAFTILSCDNIQHNFIFCRATRPVTLRLDKE